jgi:P protein
MYTMKCGKTIDKFAILLFLQVHRTFAAIIASTLAIGFLASLNDRPTHDEIIGWVDVESILLLFSMMILVGIMTETGVFDHLAVYAYRVSCKRQNMM